MALITFSSSAEKRGVAITVTLDKAALVEQVKEPFYEDQNVWQRVTAVLASDGQAQHVDVTSGSGTFQTSSVAEGGTWTVTSIQIQDYDNGVYALTEGLGSFTLEQVSPDKPSITYPTNGLIDVIPPFNLTSSAYNVTGQTNDNHTESDWIIEESDGTKALQSYNNSTDLVSKEVTDQDIVVNKTYYARCRQEGDEFGTSQWSDPVTFQTAASFVNPYVEAQETASSGDYTSGVWNDVSLTSRQLFPTEVSDVLGIFTNGNTLNPTIPGDYRVQMNMIWQLSPAWDGGFVYIGLFLNGVEQVSYTESAPTTNGDTVRPTQSYDRTISLLATDTLEIKVKHTGTGGKTRDASGSGIPEVLTIEKV